MSMPGRKFAATSDYRYGFNGKENDKDISEGGQDYGMRIYDSRLGRFLSEDPITKKYPELTPYQFASNRPIEGIDLDGLEFVSTKAEDAYWAEKGVKINRPTSSGLFKTPDPAKSKPSPATIKPTYSDNTVIVKRQSSMAFSTPPDPEVLKADLFGTGIIGKESVVDATIARHRYEYYSAWGENIRGGFFGALGSYVDGVRGSSIGAAVDGIAQSFAGIERPGTSSVLSKNTLSLKVPKFNSNFNNGCTFLSLKNEAASGSINESSLKGLVPNGNPSTFNPSPTILDGYKYQIILGNTTAEVKWHSPDLNAPVGSNSNSGWTAQIKVGNKYLNRSGGLQNNNKSNETHIPVKVGE